MTGILVPPLLVRPGGLDGTWSGQLGGGGDGKQTPKNKQLFGRLSNLHPKISTPPPYEAIFFKVSQQISMGRTENFEIPKISNPQK